VWSTRWAHLLLPLTLPGKQLVHDGKLSLASGPFEPRAAESPGQAKGDECSDDFGGVSCCHAAPVRAHAKQAWYLNGGARSLTPKGAEGRPVAAGRRVPPVPTVSRAGWTTWFSPTSPPPHQWGLARAGYLSGQAGA